MRILNFRPDPPGSGRWHALAIFDVQVTDDFRACNWALKRNADGAFRVYPPAVSHGGNTAATVSPALRVRLTELAIAEYRANGVRDAHAAENAA